ncbi:hypothetical protein LSCM1_05661 [Leishmania martiniquensis]|uniref:Uncharacterized protein n=1 Tax=Leishmania martiniquensis TaxID=1580590 RepID=A0A836GXH2_9TRYP|nr:hypothetical protein LSCM1_05661 [Leishmania martiniquensis]
MDVRLSCLRAPKQMRHTWTILMMDECTAMAPPRIAAFVQRTLEGGCGVWVKSSVEPTACTTTSDKEAAAVADQRCSSTYCSLLPASASPFSSLVGEPTVKARAWAAVARLLCESGDWVRAAAVVEALPFSVQQATKHKAVRDEWPLPPLVREAWRRAPAAVIAKPAAIEAPLSCTRASMPEKTSGIVAPLSRMALASCRTTELVRAAYSLCRPRATETVVTPSAATPATTLHGLKSEQQAIIAELRRRGAALEAVQCVVNWQRRHLALPHAREAAVTASMGRRSDAFDGVQAVKSVLFPFVPAPGDGGRRPSGSPAALNSTFEPRSAQRGGRPPLYALSHLEVIHQVAANHPITLAQCLRDRAVVDRLLRHAGDAAVAEVTLLLMGRVAGLGGGRVEQQPSAQASLGQGDGVTATLTKEAGALARLQRTRADNLGISAPASTASLLAQAEWKSAPCDGAAAAETCWQALAALLFPLHPYIHAQPKTRKEKLLSALLSAIDGTACMMAGDRAPSTPSWSAAGCGGSATRPTQDGAGLQRGRMTPVALSDKTRHAIKAAVESVCSPLLGHEPQVRFIRLSTFGVLARALRGLGVPVPNALAQCLFLCMADTAVAPLDSGASGCCSDPVFKYLSCPPSSRWLHALAMLSSAHRESTYRVSAAHERALLSGLQSVSITQTWTTALRTVAELERTYNITPDERTLPTLLLNLKQKSWQDAFRVLRYVPGQEADRASPSVLRDLQLVALKHASWVVPLRLMTHLQQRQADGLMNYLYCVCAAARSGDSGLTFEFFQSLKGGRGRHSVLRGLSPYNELTVAVAAVAMLDYGQEEALVSFSARVAAMPVDSDAGDFAVKAEAESGNPLLTVDGLSMAQAAHACALLALHRYEALTSLLKACPAASLRAVLRRVVVLQCLLGLDHLRAPVRLVFDVVGYGGSTLQRSEVPSPEDANQNPSKTFLVAVAAGQKRDGTFETRQRGTAERRQHLYIPNAHQRRQKKALAAGWGLFMRYQEAALPPHVARLVAESMVEEGVGAEYLKVALL